MLALVVKSCAVGCRTLANSTGVVGVFHMTVHGMMQQSHSKSPQSQPKQGFVVPLMGFWMDEVDDVEGGMAACSSGSGWER